MTTERAPTSAPDPAAEGLDPALLDPAAAVRDGHTTPFPAVTEGGPAATAPESGDSYAAQSREAFTAAQEAGRAFARRVGHTATSKFVRRGEASGTGDGSAEGAAPTREAWGERAKAAKNRTMNRLENRWQKRAEKREDDRLDRQHDRAQARIDRHDRKVKKQMDKIDDKLDLRVHKRTMTRRDFRKYKMNKQIQKDVAKAKAHSDKIMEKKRLKGEDKAIKIEAKNVKIRAKADVRRRGVEHASALRLNREFDRREADKRKADEMRRRILNPDDWRKEKAEKRRERVQRARKMGGKVLHGANVATKVAVGASLAGGETAAKVARGSAEAVKNDERAKYVKLRAELGWAAVRKSMGEAMAAASERLLPTQAEQAAIDNGELPMDSAAEVSVDLHPAGEAADAEGKVLTHA